MVFLVHFSCCQHMCHLLVQLYSRTSTLLDPSSQQQQQQQQQPAAVLYYCSTVGELAQPAQSVL
jgi:hypothetical protein